MIQLSLSILSADHLHLEEQLTPLYDVVDRIHYDVMDGHFVPNIALGFPLLEQWKCPLPIDTHLMISNPEKHIERFAKYADTVYIHWEAGEEKSIVLLDTIRTYGAKAGITLNPETPASVLFPHLEKISHVLIMSVHPGFGGQSCLVETFDKIALLKEKKPELIIMVDGGITDTTAPLAREKGADILVSGSYLIHAQNPETTAGLLRGKV